MTDPLDDPDDPAATADAARAIDGAGDAAAVVDGDGVRDAGSVDDWLRQMMAALRGTADSDVACGSCVACCASHQFVHVAPDEHDTLAHLPAEVVFPAPGMPTGYVVIGHDAQGRCPMLGAVGCSIHPHRPRACRVYDCRVFTVSGIEPDDDQPDIAARARTWRFEVTDDADAEAWRAVRAVAAVLDDPAAYPDRRVPRGSQRAAIAVGLHELGRSGVPTAAAVRVELTRRRG